jgi:signal transduction histidine kinase
MPPVTQPSPSPPAHRVWIGAGAPIVVLVLLVTVLAAALVANFARVQDRGFETESVRLMQSALDERARAVSNQAWDYGNWDDAYRFVTLAWDQDWIDNNYFTSIADGLVVFRPEATAPRHVWLAETYAPRAAAIAAAVTEAARAQLRVAPPRGDARPIHSGRMLIDGRLALFSIAPVRMMDGDAPERDYVVIVEIFEPEEIGEIAAARDLEDARFMPGAAAAAGVVALPIDNVGAMLGSLAWRNEKPGSAAFVGQLWPILLAFIAIGVMTLFVARRMVAAQVEAAARAESALESSRMRSEFISTMSHELRTPLNAIIGYAELIEEEAEEVDAGIGAVILTDAGHVLAAAKHLRQLVDDVLDHSRFDAGRIRIVIERLPVDALLVESEELMAPLAAARGNELVFHDNAGEYEVMADHTRLRQCLINLIGNAVKFTRNGAISVVARLEAAESGARIVFDVSDTGIGIEEAVLEKLFEPFVQATTAAQSSYGGAGLGLSIARKLARAMGGDITVTSERGRGSTFSLSLPAARPLPSLAAVAA